MEKFWNLLFYLTWKSLSFLSDKMITSPIQKLTLRFYPKKRNAKSQNYKRYINQQKKSETDPAKSTNIRHAFKFMLYSTSMGIGVLLMIVNEFFEVKFPNQSIFAFVGTIAISIFLNYKFLWINDKYLEYFIQFKTEIKVSKYFLLFIFFHVVPFFPFFYLILRG